MVTISLARSSDIFRLHVVGAFAELFFSSSSHLYKARALPLSNPNILGMCCHV